MSTAELPIAKPSQARAIPKKQTDWIPLAIAPIIMLAAWPMIGDTENWVTLTIAGLAMGMIIFVIASGLTLIFGLMDVLNFGHGLFIAIGAYVGFSVLTMVPGISEWATSDNLWLNVAAILLSIVGAMVATGIVGLIFERVLVRKVYGLHLMQILITLGGAVIGEQLIMALWGADMVGMPSSPGLRGTINVLGASIEKYRLFAVVIGLAVFATMMLVLNRTKLGLLIRAGVQDREMVESLGYRIKTLFIGVFVAGSALAGLGGVLWALYQQNFTAQIGGSMNILLFIVIIIGGLGSTGGSFLGALLVGLMANYIGFLVPKVGLVSNILLMVVILAWRPNGIYKVTNR